MPTPRKYNGNSNGGGPKAQFFFNENITQNFERGGGFNLKNLPWEGYGYFLEQHNAQFCMKCDVMFNQQYVVG